MTHGAVAPQEVGRTCPYCRAALKDGVPALRCDLCQAIHHEDCWRDGGGCATYGCPNGPGKSAPPPPDPATRVMAPPPGGAFPWKVILLTFLAVLLVAGAIAAGWILTHRHQDAAPATPTPTLTATAARATPTGADQGALAIDIEKIVTFSQAGRTAAQKGRYPEAITNRRTVLRRLKAVKGATGDLAAAKGTLERAMTASLNADEAYAAHADVTKFNTQATALKQQFASQWQAVAAAHKLRAYHAGDI